MTRRFVTPAGNPVYLAICLLLALFLAACGSLPTNPPDVVDDMRTVSPTTVASVQHSPIAAATPVREPLRLVVLHTNDNWGETEPCGWGINSTGGFRRRATFVTTQRGDADHLLLLDTGDALIGGGILGDLTDGEVIIAGMNLMRYDAMALGPRELSLGLDVVRRRLAEAEFPIVSANAVDAATGELLVAPHAVLDAGPYRVAVVGLTRPLEAALPGVQVLPPAEVAPAAVTAAAADADVVILLTNLTFRSAQALLANLPEVDLLIAALPGQLPSQAVRVPGTGALAVTAEQPVARHTGRRVGRLAVTLNPDGSLTAEQWTSISITPAIMDDVTMRSLLDRFRP